jgi:hypothetical protein
MARCATLLAVLCLLPARAGAQTSAAPQSLFSSYAVLELRLSAPFDDLFAKSSHDDDYAVDGSLTYAGPDGRPRVLDRVRISVRGNTSKQSTECTFPKLKLRFARGSAHDASIFASAETLKIGTHCGESQGEQLTPKFGRLANQKAAIREAFVYQLLDVMGVPSLRARPARITYEFAGGRRAPLVRDAMLLEDTSEAMSRLHASREIGMERFGSASRELAVADTVNLALAEAMIGNFDWCLRFTPGDTYRCDANKPLWNIAALAGADGRVVPLMYDFDLSGMVTGSHFWFADVLNERFSAKSSRTEVEVVSQVQHTRSLFARADLDAARQRFLAHKSQAFTALHGSGVDAHGKTLIERYLTDFFAAIATDDSFYRPVVTAEHATAFAGADGGAAACPNAPTIPVGTPVGTPIAHHGTRVQVEVVDSLWHWTGPRKCTAIRRGPVWIEERAIGTDYPKTTRERE